MTELKMAITCMAIEKLSGGVQLLFRALLISIFFLRGVETPE